MFFCAICNNEINKKEQASIACFGVENHIDPNDILELRGKSNVRIGLDEDGGEVFLYDTPDEKNGDVSPSIPLHMHPCIQYWPPPDQNLQYALF